jgi:hypothetical protein
VQQPSREGNSHEDGSSDNLRRFLRLKPPAFLGSVNPVEADDWLSALKWVAQLGTVRWNTPMV